MTTFTSSYGQTLYKISRKCVHNFLSKPGDKNRSTSKSYLPHYFALEEKNYKHSLLPASQRY